MRVPALQQRVLGAAGGHRGGVLGEAARPVEALVFRVEVRYLHRRRELTVEAAEPLPAHLPAGAGHLLLPALRAVLAGLVAGRRSGEAGHPGAPPLPRPVAARVRRLARAGIVGAAVARLGIVHLVELLVDQAPARHDQRAPDGEPGQRLRQAPRPVVPQAVGGQVEHQQAPVKEQASRQGRRPHVPDAVVGEVERDEGGVAAGEDAQRVSQARGLDVGQVAEAKREVHQAAVFPQQVRHLQVRQRVAVQHQRVQVSAQRQEGGEQRQGVGSQPRVPQVDSV